MPDPLWGPARHDDDTTARARGCPWPPDTDGKARHGRGTAGTGPDGAVIHPA